MHAAFKIWKNHHRVLWWGYEEQTLPKPSFLSLIQILRACVSSSLCPESSSFLKLLQLHGLTQASVQLHFWWGEGEFLHIHLDFDTVWSLLTYLTDLRSGSPSTNLDYSLKPGQWISHLPAESPAVPLSPIPLRSCVVAMRSVYLTEFLWRLTLTLSEHPDGARHVLGAH